MEDISIIIGGDLVPTQSNYDFCIEGNLNSLFGFACTELLKSADVRIFNLEVPLVDKETPIEKCGPCLRAPKNTVNLLTTIQADVIGLANNHALDQGFEGLHSTISTLDEHGLQHVGAGINLASASQPLVIEKKGIKIGLYACAEHEFSIATTIDPGVNPWNPIVSLDSIMNLKKKCDYLVVLYHGGKEQYRYPTPELQQRCRKMVEKGADIVLCQHSHCVGCEEKWGNGTILYGQGNFLFDRCDNDFWKTSVLVQIDMTGSKDANISYVPIVKCGNVIRLAQDDEATKILEGLRERSIEIQESGFMSSSFSSYSLKNLDNYLLLFSGLNNNLLFRIINKLLNHKIGQFIIRRHYKMSDLLAMRNFVECESHNEMLISGLEMAIETRNRKKKNVKI